MQMACALTTGLPFAVYHAIYLEELTAAELTEKIAQLFSISPHQISQIYKQGPTGIHVLISDEVGFSVLLNYIQSLLGHVERPGALCQSWTPFSTERLRFLILILCKRF